jgi:spermidine/putrescine transport system permease protein
MKTTGKTTNTVLLFLFGGIILIPLIYNIILAFSFQPYPSIQNYRVSSRWFRSLSENFQLRDSIIRSIFMGSSIAGISLLMSFFCGYFLARKIAKRWTNIILILLVLPSITPFILYGFSLAEFARLVGFSRSPVGVIIGQIVVFSPLAVTYYTFTISGLNEDVEFAAEQLGAKTYKIYEIVFRQLRYNSMLLFFVLFALSWDEYIISWFLSGFDKNYVVQVRNMLESSFSLEVFAVGTITVFITSIIYVAFTILKGRNAG